MHIARTVAATLALALTAALTTAAPAAAGTMGCTGWTAPAPRGNGTDVTIKIREYSGNVAAYDRYLLSFYSYGETLKLWDGLTDGTEAVAKVWVYNKQGQLVDTDTFRTGTTQTYNLGTPDGSGDVPEGYTLRFELSGGGVTCGGGQQWWGRA
jgi:hypothetical protein